MFHKGEELGHDIVTELHVHIDAFHKGLDALEDRMLHRKTVIEDRMADLEYEHSDIKDGLDHIRNLRP